MHRCTRCAENVSKQHQFASGQFECAATAPNYGPGLSGTALIAIICTLTSPRDFSVRTGAAPETAASKSTSSRSDTRLTSDASTSFLHCTSFAELIEHEVCCEPHLLVVLCEEPLLRCVPRLSVALVFVSDTI